MDRVQWNLDILDVIEALDFEQPFRHVLRRNTDPRNFGKADGRYFRRSLLSRPRFTANQSYGCGRRKRGQHAAPILSGLTSAVLHLHDKSPLRGAIPAHTFSSRLTSSRKRQSVASAMILLGFDLIMPTSRSRREKNRIVSSGS